MSKLYNRIMTMGMISMTALLAWVYCLINYRGNLLYIGIISVVLVGSVYALLLAFAGLKAAKEETLMRFVNDTVNQSLDRLNSTQDKTDIERIAKASYVQLRKNNTLLSKMIEAQSSHSDISDKQQLELHEDLKMLINDSVGKAAKVIVKYNKIDSEKQNEIIEKQNNTIEQLSEKLSLVTEQLEKVTEELNAVKDSINDLELPAPVAIQSSNEAASFPSHNTSDDEATSKRDDNNKVYTSKSEDSSVEKINDTLDIFGSIGLNQNDVDSLWDDTENEAEAPNLDSFFNEFGSKTLEEASAPIADVIPFPTSDDNSSPASESKPEAGPEPEPVAAEEPVIAEESADPNKMLSPEEIAALFAAASPASESKPEAEPEPEPVAAEEPVIAEESADPNKMLSPEEIAALFAAASPASESMPEPTPEPVKEEIKEEPVDETPTDPNKMLSPDEIAALFASMGVS